MIYQVGDTYYVGALFLDADGVGQTGESPIVHIRRASDGMFWTGSGYSSTPTDLAMTEVSAANAPGEYVYAFTPTAAGQYFGTCFEDNSGGPYGGTIVGPVQPFEVYFGIPWTELVDAAISSRLSTTDFNAGVTAILNLDNSNAAAILAQLASDLADVLAAIGAQPASLVATLRALPGILARSVQPPRIKIPYRTDLLIRLIGPQDAETGAPILAAPSGDATGELRIYDPALVATLAAAASSPDVILTVTNAAALAASIGEPAELELDDGTRLETTISAVDPDASTVTIANPVPSGASPGRRLRVRLGNAITLAQYGTPAQESTAWGFEGPLPDDHPGLILDRAVDLELGFVGVAAGGFFRLRTLFGVISAQADDVAVESAGAIVPRVKSHGLT